MRPVAVLGLALLPVALAGCKSDRPPSDYAVLTGTVRYQGKPLQGGTVLVTHTADGRKSEYQAIIRSDGRYRLECKPGPVQLAVETESLKMSAAGAPGAGKEAGKGQGPGKPGPDPPGYVKVPAKYGNPEKSGLTADLALGEQTKDLDLQ